jgi:histidine triad (HIT) family protein
VTNSCVFCAIIARTIPADIIFEQDDIIVIKDIQPRAPIHYLIIPKKHVPDVQSLQKEDLTTAGSIIMVAQQLSESLSGAKAFRLICNSGADVGQVVFHLHFHFIAGKFLPDF